MLVRVRTPYFDGTLHETGEVFDFGGTVVPPCLIPVSEPAETAEEPKPAAKRPSRTKKVDDLFVTGDQEVI